MATKKQMQSIYNGPKEHLPNPGDYGYHFIEQFYPFISSFTFDEFGQPTLTLKEKAEVTRDDMLSIFRAFYVNDIARVDLAPDGRVRLIIN